MDGRTYLWHLRHSYCRIPASSGPPRSLGCYSSARDGTCSHDLLTTPDETHSPVTLFRFRIFISRDCKLPLSSFRILECWGRSPDLQWPMELWLTIPAPTLKACLTSEGVWWDKLCGGWDEMIWGEIGLDGCCSSPDLRWWRHRSRRDNDSSRDVTSDVGRRPSWRLWDLSTSTCWCNCWVQCEKASKDVSSLSLFSLWACTLASVSISAAAGEEPPFLLELHSSLASLPSSTLYLLLSYVKEEDNSR